MKIGACLVKGTLNLVVYLRIMAVHQRVAELLSKASSVNGFCVQ